MVITNKEIYEMLPNDMKAIVLELISVHIFSKTYTYDEGIDFGINEYVRILKIMKNENKKHNNNFSR